MMPQGITRSLPENASGHHPVPAGECLKASPVLKGLRKCVLLGRARNNFFLPRAILLFIDFV